MATKEYKLIDLVSRGSNARKEVDATVICSDGEYKRGTILDANFLIPIINKLAEQIAELMLWKQQQETVNPDGKISGIKEIENFLNGISDQLNITDIISSSSSTPSVVDEEMIFNGIQNGYIED